MDATLAPSLAPLSPRTGIPAPGQVVKCRTRAWLVDAVEPSPHGTKVALSCLEDDAQGEELEVIWELELDTQIIDREAWKAIGRKGFDDPRFFSAFVRTLRWHCVTATDPRLFQSPFRAGIRLDAYQLEPLRKALLLPRVNLFIADDVGLGKTIEAGLIASELLLRRRVKDIVVVCPPSMVPQWQGELESRFGLVFNCLDRLAMERIRQERGWAVNPWSVHPRWLVSSKLLIDETYAGPLRDWLGNLRPASLLIFDEAHHAAPSSDNRYAIDSRITRAVRDLAPRFEHRLFLSATPHNGHSNSFSALLEILDPQRFTRGVKVRVKDLDPVMVRRLKEDIRARVGGFPGCVVKQIDIDGLASDAPELELPRLPAASRPTLRRPAGESSPGATVGRMKSATTSSPASWPSTPSVPNSNASPASRERRRTPPAPPQTLTPTPTPLRRPPALRRTPRRRASGYPRNPPRGRCFPMNPEPPATTMPSRRYSFRRSFT